PGMTYLPVASILRSAFQLSAASVPWAARATIRPPSTSTSAWISSDAVMTRPPWMTVRLMGPSSTRGGSPALGRTAGAAPCGSYTYGAAGRGSARRVQGVREDRRALLGLGDGQGQRRGDAEHAGGVAAALADEQPARAGRFED